MPNHELRDDDKSSSQSFSSKRIKPLEHLFTEKVYKSDKDFPFDTSELNLNWMLAYSDEFMPNDFGLIIADQSNIHPVQPVVNEAEVLEEFDIDGSTIDDKTGLSVARNRYDCPIEKPTDEQIARLATDRAVKLQMTSSEYALLIFNPIQFICKQFEKRDIEISLVDGQWRLNERDINRPVREKLYCNHVTGNQEVYTLTEPALVDQAFEVIIEYLELVKKTKVGFRLRQLLIELLRETRTLSQTVLHPTFSETSSAVLEQLLSYSQPPLQVREQYYQILEQITLTPTQQEELLLFMSSEGDLKEQCAYRSLLNLACTNLSLREVIPLSNVDLVLRVMVEYMPQVLKTPMESVVRNVITNFIFASRIEVFESIIPEYPDATAMVIKCLKDSDGLQKTRYEYYALLEQIKLPVGQLESLLRYMDSQGDFNHPLAHQAMKEMSVRDPDSEVTKSHERRRQELLDVLIASPQKLFDNYYQLLELAQGLVSAGSLYDDDLQSKVGLEVEIGLSKKFLQSSIGQEPVDVLNETAPPGFKFHEDLINYEMTREYDQLVFNSEYIHQMTLAGKWLQLRATHLSSLHLHFDRTQYPEWEALAMGGLLMNEYGTIVANDLGTWEVRGLMIPTIPGQPERLDVAQVENLIELYRHAQSSDISDPIKADANFSYSWQQLMFGHICRHLSDPEARLAALMATRQLLALLAFNPMAVMLSYDQLTSNLQQLPTKSQEDMIELIECFQDPGTPTPHIEKAFKHHVLAALLLSDRYSLEEINELLRVSNMGSISGLITGRYGCIFVDQLSPITKELLFQALLLAFNNSQDPTERTNVLNALKVADFAYFIDESELLEVLIKGSRDEDVRLSEEFINFALNFADIAQESSRTHIFRLMTEVILQVIRSANEHQYSDAIWMLEQLVTHSQYDGNILSFIEEFGQMLHADNAEQRKIAVNVLFSLYQLMDEQEQEQLLRETLEMLADEDEHVRVAVINNCRYLSLKDLELKNYLIPLMQATVDDESDQVKLALLKLISWTLIQADEKVASTAVDVLEVMIEDQNPDVRKEVANSLASLVIIDLNKVIELQITMLQDSEKEVRWFAANSLFEMIPFIDQSDLPKIEKVLSMIKKDTDRSVRDQGYKMELKIESL